jgi:hypothetical protein
MQAGDVEVNRADGSHHSHQDRTIGTIKTILARSWYSRLLLSIKTAVSLFCFPHNRP